MFFKKKEKKDSVYSREEIRQIHKSNVDNYKKLCKDCKRKYKKSVCTPLLWNNIMVGSNANDKIESFLKTLCSDCQKL